MLASLETQSGLAPGSHRTGVTNRCAALATAVGVVAGVHNGTTLPGRTPMWRLRPALPRLTFSWSMLETWPTTAVQFTGTLRISPEADEPERSHSP